MAEFLQTLCRHVIANGTATIVAANHDARGGIYVTTWAGPTAVHAVIVSGSLALNWGQPAPDGVGTVAQ